MSNFKLFYKLFIINLFTFGGGYTIIPVITDEFIGKAKLITYDDMEEIVSIAQSMPGVLVISTSFLLGYKIKGKVGAMLAVIASTLPSFILLTIITYFYRQFMESEIIRQYLKNISASISAVLILTVIKMIKYGIKDNRILFILVFTITLFLKVYINLSLIIILIISIIVSIIFNKYFNKDRL